MFRSILARAGALSATSILFVLAGCSTPPKIADRADYLAEGTRVYQGETRERVIQAAETILKISDPEDFEFRHQPSGFTGYRKYLIYLVLAAERGQDKWDFHADEKPGGVEASVSVSKAGVASGGYSATAFEGAVQWIPLYRLFWKRMDYMLGKRPDWTTCEQEAAAVRAAGTTGIDGLGALCGMTSQGKDAVPPPLPKRQTLTASERNVADRDRARRATLGR